MVKKSATLVAVAWYPREEWEKLRKVAVDADGMESTYEEWLAHAEMAMGAAEQSGHQVAKVIVPVDHLVAWCRKKGLAIDGKARSQYAAERGRTEI